MLDFVLHSTFAEVAALLVLASAVGFAGLALRQPLVVSFIAAGVLAGPSVLGIVHSSEMVALLSELGIAVLLFLVGLQLDLKLIRQVGPVALVAGLGQIAFTAILGFLLGVWLGLETVGAAYIAVALTFSSTIIVVKLLSDRRELDALHGRIALGCLIVQDLVVVVCMIALAAAEVGEGGALGASILEVLAVGVALLAATGLFMRYVANWLTHRLVRSPELIICFALGWATLLGALAEQGGLSMELGGLLAGVSLASTPYREAIAARLGSLRDFMLLFFFIALGSRLDVGVIGDLVGEAIALSAFVLLGKPLLILAIMVAMGYRACTGFLTGITMGQISEFSLILMAMGLAVGDVDEAALGLVTAVSFVTIALSSYMILWSHRIGEFCAPLLRHLERRTTPREPDGEAAEGSKGGWQLVLFGLGRYGAPIARALQQAEVRVLAIDFDPQAVARFRDLGIDARYGNADDHAFLDALPLDGVAWVVSAVHSPYDDVSGYDHRLALVGALRRRGYAGKVALTAHDPRDAVRLRQAGADLVLMPFVDASKRAAELLVEALNPQAEAPTAG
ncbi:MAG: cation:proton antiporter [Alphaproteobacteria bacterium]